MTEEQLRNFRQMRLTELLPDGLFPFIRGNCYVACEAIYHLLGGKKSGWVPMNMQVGDDSHWFLKHKETGVILDPTGVQFTKVPDYSKARGRGFLTKVPSHRARYLMDKILWQRS